MLPSIIQENFLDHDILDSIAQTVLAAHSKYDDYVGNGKLASYYYTWKFYDPKFRDIYDQLLPIFQQTSQLSLIVDHSHILDSLMPYGVHTDYYQRRMLPTKLDPAYTIIIPLATCPTHTIAFDQNSEIKDFSTYHQINRPKPVDAHQRISQQIRKEYLSHVADDVLDYFSIKEIFPWKKGSVYFCDRRYFHCSDNYTANGLTGKRALVFWTSLPKQ